MKTDRGSTRRDFLAAAGAALGAAAVPCWGDVARTTGPVTTPHADLAALRRQIVDGPVRVALWRARTFTKVFRQNDDKPWIVRKALALREYFQTVPLYLREQDGLAGSISELPGAMPVMVELGIGENGIYTGERPDRVHQAIRVEGHGYSCTPDHIMASRSSMVLATTGWAPMVTALPMPPSET